MRLSVLMYIHLKMLTKVWKDKVMYDSLLSFTIIC